jgi:hypothetical protein
MVVCYNFNCEDELVIKKAEWMAGMQAANACDVAALKARLPALRAAVDGEPLASSLAAFQKFWAWCYVFSRPLMESGAKSKQLPLDLVKGLSGLMDSRKGRFPWADSWKAFLDSLDPKKVVVSRDTWSQLPELGAKVRAADLSDFKEQAHWPVLFDDFNEWCIKARAAAGGGGGGGGGGV